MKALAAARPAHLGGDGVVDEATRRAELSRAWSRPRATARRRRRVVFVPAVLTGAAGVTAVVLALAAGHGGPGPRRPSPAPVRLDPESVFLSAADKAERQPMGRYWYTDQVGGQSYIVKDGYAITGAMSESFEWTAVKAGGGDRLYFRWLPARPATADDEAAWRRAGSPKSFRVWSNDHYQTYNTLRAGAWGREQARDDSGGQFFVPGGSLTAKEILDLPTDPATLAKRFVNWTPKLPHGAKLRNGYQLYWVARLFESAPLPPKVRAGLMRALVAQPGLRTIGPVTDQLGRRGVAITADESSDDEDFKGDPYTEREQLIFDPRTGDLLADENVLDRPGGEYHSRKPGFVINYTLIRESRWTDARPTPPRTLPFPPL